jgi:hypothetical protein
VQADIARIIDRPKAERTFFIGAESKVFFQ